MDMSAYTPDSNGPGDGRDLEDITLELADRLADNGDSSCFRQRYIQENRRLFRRRNRMTYRHLFIIGYQFQRIIGSKSRKLGEVG